VYSNRAAAYLKLENFDMCVQDCLAGLELIQREEDIIKDELKQDDGQNETRRQLKCKLLVRLGTCYCQMGTMDQGLQHYEKAVALDPQNESLAQDLNALRSSMSVEGNKVC
jgi:tetratricopeptide (TPR) repeat protein